MRVVTVVLPLVPVTPTSAIPARVGPFGREVDLRADVDPEVAGGREHCMVLGYARAGDEQLPARQQAGKGGGLGPLDHVDAGRPDGRDPLGVPRSPGPVLDHEHVVAGGVEPADDRLAGPPRPNTTTARAISR